MHGISPSISRSLSNSTHVGTFSRRNQVGSRVPRQAIGCNFPCYRVIFDVDNAKPVVKWMQKKSTKYFKSKTSDTIVLTLYSYLFKLLDFNRKSISVVMQSGNVV